MAKMEAGVVYGEKYQELLQSCKDGGYALPAVNVVGSNSINAVMEAAAANDSDIIIQLSNGGAQFMAGQGMADGDAAKVMGAVAAANHVHLLAKYYGVCVVLHTDHANRKLLPWIDGLVAAGAEYYEKHGRPLYSSHMLDLSEEALDDNLSTCAEYLKKIVPLEMSLEIELGVTGGEEDGVGSDDDITDNAKLYTQPDEVLQAYNLLSPIGHFSVAASFGNVHGVYKPGNVQLRPEILKSSQERPGPWRGRQPLGPGFPRRFRIGKGEDRRGHQLRRHQDEHRYRYAICFRHRRRRLRGKNTTRLLVSDRSR